MWKLIVMAILLFIALPCLLRPTWTVEGEKFRAWLLGCFVLFLAIVFFLANSFTQVHAKEIGVGVNFGNPVAQYDSGLHVKPIWQSITKIDGTIFTDSYGTDTPDAEKSIAVRLGDGNPAKASTTIRWHVNPDAVDYIYATYRDTDKLKNAVVETQYKAVVNDVFSTFNPTRDSSLTANFSPNYDQMAADITAKMDEAVKDASGVSLIIIDKVTVSGVIYTGDTERRISGIVQQQAKTQQAKLLEDTNTNLALANSKLSSSLSGPDGEKVLVQQCLQDLADKKFVAPAGFSCWPATGGSVVIPASK